ncbi:hypothetical protein [Salibacterium halotolerans]|uniref:Uncharacterized protein n=1 Tax=Salibacterium halotolerans TaxID=1884432 RepID=A0A1I5NC99_9BACI|nr:hypothetical protein [Salibacterium halotolerans]SFP19399.1 hypothetical protein SAMN05518683_10379 [Salibacterium halotolerans]
MSDEQKNNEWYSNKDLFEQLNDVRADFHGLRTEMKETRTMIKQYNGLREEVGEVRNKIEKVKGQVNQIEAQAQGRSKTWDAIRVWGGWIVGVLGMAAAYLKLIL